MLLNILECAGQRPTTKDYPAQNVTSGRNCIALKAVVPFQSDSQPKLVTKAIMLHRLTLISPQECTYTAEVSTSWRY